MPGSSDIWYAVEAKREEMAEEGGAGMENARKLLSPWAIRHRYAG